MKVAASRVAVSLVSHILLLSAHQAWAGPAEEVADIGRQRAHIFREGNLDAWMTAYADTAVLSSSLAPFRIEGKAAIRAHYARLFHTYPTRWLIARQPSTRVFGDSVVITDGYLQLTNVDRNGQASNIFLRNSLTWFKIAGQWRIIDQHVSPPFTPP